MFTEKQLKTSFYYAGAGTDLEPLRRFSHLTNIFVYADLEAESRRIVAGFRAQSNESLTLMDVKNLQRDGFGPPWARVFTFRRQIGNQKRRLKLLYIKAEGMAAYGWIYGMKQIAPQFVCTVQCSPLSGGTFEQCVKLWESRPRVWIRTSPLPGDHRDKGKGAKKPTVRAKGNEYDGLDENDTFDIPTCWVLKDQDYPDWSATAYVERH